MMLIFNDLQKSYKKHRKKVLKTEQPIKKMFTFATF